MNNPRQRVSLLDILDGFAPVVVIAVWLILAFVANKAAEQPPPPAVYDRP